MPRSLLISHTWCWRLGPAWRQEVSCWVCRTRSQGWEVKNCKCRSLVTGKTRRHWLASITSRCRLSGAPLLLRVSESTGANRMLPRAQLYNNGVWEGTKVVLDVLGAPKIKIIKILSSRCAPAVGGTIPTTHLVGNFPISTKEICCIHLVYKIAHEQTTTAPAMLCQIQ